MPQASFLLGNPLYNVGMIRKAQASDLKAIQALCASDSSRLLFIDGDITQNGLETDYQETWIEIEDQTIRGIFLRYHTNFVFYFKEPLRDITGFEALFTDQIKMISASKKDVDAMPDSIKSRFDFRTMYFCECATLKKQTLTLHPVQATASDSPAIVKLLSSISEFKSNLHTTEEERTKNMIERYEQNKIHGFIIKEDEQVIAHASTGVETASGVMVVAVATAVDQRKKGYGRAVVYAVTEYALQRGQKPCLFYDNPEAGKIYHDLGYVTFDLWCLGSLKA
jgi:predicted GNAT family acetyltransferase